MKIEVFGTGCAKCRSLEAAVRRTADRFGLDYTLEHVSDLKTMVARGVMITPALSVDGQIKAMGQVPDEARLTSILTMAAGAAGR